jgi:hypothetical protein
VLAVRLDGVADSLLNFLVRTHLDGVVLVPGNGVVWFLVLVVDLLRRDILFTAGALAGRNEAGGILPLPKQRIVWRVLMYGGGLVSAIGAAVDTLGANSGAICTIIGSIFGIS